MRGTSYFRLLSSAILIAGLAGIGAPVASAAALNSIPDRITMEVSNGSMTEIPGSVQPKALHATDLGPVPGDTRLTGMSLRFLPSAAQQAALDQLLADLQDPSSPRFHQWLTPQQYAAQFGLSAGDLAKITAWLASQGFTVTAVAQGGTFVTFDGTVAQAQTAFSTSIHSLSVNGETHFANLTNLSVPSAFAGVVGAVTGLHDFHLKPHLHASVVQPQFTSSISGNHWVAPGDLYTIYDTQPLLNSGINGSGISIAVMGIVDISTADVAAFRSAAGLSTTNLPTTVHAYASDPGGAHDCYPSPTTTCAQPNLNDLAEASLDVEWSGAMAPSASILFVNGRDIFEYSLTYAVDQNVAPIVTVSYGACEAGEGSSFMNAYNQLFKQANSQGQTIMVAAGDTGATDCDSNLTETTATEGLAVDFPASSPYVTAMGGTMFTGDAAATCIGGACNDSTPSDFAATTYWAGTPNSTDAISSALKYIPEAAWNDASYGGFEGGGGGASSFFAKPAWQIEGVYPTTTSVAPDGARDVPDLALDASDAHDTLLLCYNGYCGNGFRIATGPDAGNLTSAGGTSFDAPIFGGMLALIEQKNSITKGAGNINPLLYALGNNATYYSNPFVSGTTVFHDITAGGNVMPCQAGSIECPNGGNIGYSAAPGYDLATGWGSVDLYNLAGAWSWAEAHPEGLGSLGSNISSTALASSTSTSSPTTVAVGAAITLTATVTGATIITANPLTTTPGPTPTGTVQFLINNVVVGSGTLNSSGVATYAWSPACSAVGVAQNATAVYSGDATYQGSVGPALTLNGTSINQTTGAIINTPLVLTVTAGTICPYYSVAGPLGSVNVASGGTIPAVTITATSMNGFTGTVAFSYYVASTSGYVPTISLNPLSVALAANGSATTTLSLSGIIASLHLPNTPGAVDPGTMLARGPARTPSASHTRFAAGSGIAIASLLLLVLPRRRRRLGGLLLVALSVALALGATGCGGSSQSGPPSPNSNPYAGQYIITITGTFNGTPSIAPQSTTVTYYIQ